MKIFLLLAFLSNMLLASIGTVAAMRGKAEVINESGVKALSIGSQILQKDTIKTQAATKVQVILNDDTVVTIGPNSSYSFEEYGDEKDPHVSMRLNHGMFKAITGRIGKIAPNRFKVKTKSATIGIRGTHFMAVQVGDIEKIGCIKGAIVVTTPSGNFEVPLGNMVVLDKGTWSVKPIEIKVFNKVLSSSNEAKNSSAKDDNTQESTKQERKKNVTQGTKVVSKTQAQKAQQLYDSSSTRVRPSEIVQEQAVQKNIENEIKKDTIDNDPTDSTPFLSEIDAAFENISIDTSDITPLPTDETPPLDPVSSTIVPPPSTSTVTDTAFDNMNIDTSSIDPTPTNDTP